MLGTGCPDFWMSAYGNSLNLLDLKNWTGYLRLELGYLFFRYLFLLIGQSCPGSDMEVGSNTDEFILERYGSPLAYKEGFLCSLLKKTLLDTTILDNF